MSQTGIRRWSRGVRLALYTAIVVVTVLSSIIGATLAIAMTDCDESSAKSAVLCSATSRELVTLVVLILMVALGVPWVLYLARVLGIQEESDPTIEQVSAPELPESWSAAPMPLPFGQHFIAGKIDSVDAGAHRITVRALILRFWGGSALRNGDLGTGERSAFVYQTIPLLGLKYVLVFWKGGDAPVQSVGGLIHTFFLALGLGGATLVPALKQGYPMWFIPICGALCVESCVYLLLLLFAKKALHGFIDRSVAN